MNTNLFSEDSEDTIDIREALGNFAKELSWDELRDLSVNVKYLCESWLDDWEKEIFTGKTVSELLSEDV